MAELNIIHTTAFAGDLNKFLALGVRRSLVTGAYELIVFLDGFPEPVTVFQTHHSTLIALAFDLLCTRWKTSEGGEIEFPRQEGQENE